MEPMLATDLLRRLAAAVALAVLTGVAVALLVSLGGTPVQPTDSYVLSKDFGTHSVGHQATGRIGDPRR